MLSAILQRIITFGHAVIGQLERIDAAVKTISSIDVAQLDVDMRSLEKKMEVLEASS